MSKIGFASYLSPLLNEDKLMVRLSDKFIYVGDIEAVFCRVLEVYYEAQGIAMQVLDDLVDSYVLLIVFMIVSCVLVFIFIAVMRLIAWLVVWTLLLTVHVALGAGKYN